MTNDYAEVAEILLKGMTELKRASHATRGAFGKLVEVVYSDGTVSSKTKELIALAIGITVRCDGCLAHHAGAACEAGASREEVIEAIGVAMHMGGGPSLVYGSEALKAFNQLAAPPTDA